MPVLEGRAQERQGIMATANLMVVAARTAPKAGGKDDIRNRIYYRIGVAARRLRYLPEASVILGIPLSATGKNPHFDRERGK
ncbi:MAG: DUF2148 domain-containing protein [Syntrophales bacterium]